VLSRGAFTDAAGKTHAWQINLAHALIWNGNPYLPVGGRFQARSWTSGGAETADADWQSDVDALAKLKERGVTDLYVQPARGGGLLSVPGPAIQRLLDHLEREGFTYGLSINDAPTTP
jgi:hypothetical protein